LCWLKKNSQVKCPHRHPRYDARKNRSIVSAVVTLRHRHLSFTTGRGRFFSSCYHQPPRDPGRYSILYCMRPVPASNAILWHDHQLGQTAPPFCVFCGTGPLQSNVPKFHPSNLRPAPSHPPQRDILLTASLINVAWHRRRRGPCQGASPICIRVTETHTCGMCRLTMHLRRAAAHARLQPNCHRR
jgi:hypothetical protein